MNIAETVPFAVAFDIVSLLDCSFDKCTKFLMSLWIADLPLLRMAAILAFSEE